MVASRVDQDIVFLPFGQTETDGMFAASDNGCLEQGHCGKVNLEVSAAVGTDNTLVAKVKVGCVKACAAV